jgi:hypothetical protein
MKKIVMKLCVVGWIVGGVGVLTPEPWVSYCLGVSAGLFISSIWIGILECENPKNE